MGGSLTLYAPPLVSPVLWQSPAAPELTVETLQPKRKRDECDCFRENDHRKIHVTTL